MDYERKYKDALERARTSFSYPDYPGFMRVDVIFPELKESEDERIVRCLLNYFNHVRYNGLDLKGTDIDEVIAWLEKQGNKKQAEHLELKSGHWYMCHRPYCCRADNLTVKEGEKFQCEKDGVVKGFVIKDPEKYFMEISTPDSIEDDLNDEVRRISTIQVLEYAKSLDAYNQYGKEDIDKNITWLEKQGEQKPTEDVKTLDAYKVIAWLNENVADFWRNPCNPNRVVNQFKKDFGL